MSLNCNDLELEGTNTDLNIFWFDANNINGTGKKLTDLTSIKIFVPAGSTVLINVGGTNIQFGSYQIFVNGVAADRDD